MKIGFTCSSFDLLHAGHVQMLRDAKEQCDYLMVDLIDILELYTIHVRILGEEYRNKEFTGKDICQKKSIELFFNKRDHRFSTSTLRKSCAWVNRDGDWKMTAEG